MRIGAPAAATKQAELCSSGLGGGLTDRVVLSAPAHPRLHGVSVVAHGAVQDKRHER
jgi:hypothetical protein